MNKKLSGGFVALIGIMIATMIMIFLAAQQYQRLAERNHKVIPVEEQAQSAIEKAEGARDALEVRSSVSY